MQGKEECQAQFIKLRNNVGHEPISWSEELYGPYTPSKNTWILSKEAQFKQLWAFLCFNEIPPRTHHFFLVLCKLMLIWRGLPIKSCHVAIKKEASRSLADMAPAFWLCGLSQKQHHAVHYAIVNRPSMLLLQHCANQVIENFSQFLKVRAF